MSVQLIRRLITVREYHIMAESGILTEEDRVELLRGEIVHMSPIGSKHAACVNRLTELLVFQLRKRAILSTQSPVVLDDLSEPEPDFAVLRSQKNYYSDRLPRAEDVILLIEVSDTTLDKDREVKLPLYAASGIPEAWIINLEKDEVEVYREPIGDIYRRRDIYRKGDEIEVETFSISVKVIEMLGE